MAWTKVSERRWERPLDGLEGYFAFTSNLTASVADGREHYTLFSQLKIDINLDEAESGLKHAWKQLRYEQPQLATVAEGVKVIYEVPDEAELQDWLTTTFIVSSALNAEELYQSVKPMKQATLYYIPKSSELLFRGHHYTVDGIGMLLFWDRYLTALATPVKDIAFGDEHTRLAPTMEEVLKYPEQPTPEVAEKAGALFMDWASSMPGIGPMSKLGIAPAGKSQNAEMTFPVQTTEAIIKKCKSKGISVTAAVHAAYVRAIIKYADPNSKLSEYVTANQFNLRPYLPEPYNTSHHAISVYYTPYPFKLNLPATFWEIAKELNVFYKDTFKKNPGNLELKGHFTRVLCGAVQTPEFLASPISKDALVSSLGVVERYCKRSYSAGSVQVKVQDIKTGVDVVMGMSMFFIYTFDDQLRLVYSYNDGFEEPADIQKYLDEVQKVLVEELLS